MSRSTPEVDSRVVGTADYVLPKPPGKPADFVVSATAPALQRHRDAALARAIGDRALATAECQHHLLGELRSCLHELDRSIGESTRVRMQSQVRSALSVLDWCDAVLDDQLVEARLAAEGKQPLDLRSRCDGVAARWRAGGADVEVVGAACTWWGDGEAIDELLDLGLQLVRERTPGAASLVARIETTHGAIGIELEATGSPGDDLDGDTVRRFRAAAAAVGAVVAPGRFGSGGTGMRIHLPIVVEGAVVPAGT